MPEPRKFLDGEAFKSLEDAQRGLREPEVTVTLDEGQRQMVLLALAILSIERPGFLWTLEQIALKMDNVVDSSNDPVVHCPQIFTRLRELNSDRRSNPGG